ncbi:MAG: HXXEE domain-containing protein [Myxococcales bacterium]|nr:HXXEE domain-containing protein [Myxococcales bacterium]MDD9966020.1 HXXEE domain-containing protein [Myxococcales bacterium]
MNVEAIPRFLRGLSYRQAVWLGPVAYAIHILEEAQNFAAWASAHFAKGFTTAQFVKNNLIIMGILVALTALASLYPRRWTALIHFFQLSAGILHNALFHMAATAYLGVYSPGLLSAILLYIPVFYLITARGYRAGLLPNFASIPLFLLAGMAHANFVYTQLLTTAHRL